MKITQFDVNWKHGYIVTRHSGKVQKARLLCANKKGSWPTVALVTYRGDIEGIEEFDKDGKSTEYLYGKPLSVLSNAPEPLEDYNSYNIGRPNLLLRLTTDTCVRAAITGANSTMYLRNKKEVLEVIDWLEKAYVQMKGSDDD